LHLKQTPDGWCSVILTLVQERCPFVVARNVAGSVKSSCLRGTKNWLVRQQTDL
jgi:hypothetical protein